MKVTNVSFKINKDTLAKLDRAKKRALKLTAEAILSDILARKVVPRDVGELEKSGDVEDGHIDYELVASIVFNTPYARRWYFNLEDATFQKTKNPNAKDHWMDHYLDGEGKKWVMETYATFLKQESGGIIK